MADARCIPYRLTFTFGAWCLLTADEQRAIVGHLVEALAIADGAFLRMMPATPRLDASGVRYSPDMLVPEQGWVDVPVLLQRKRGDCKALTAWELAALRRAGIACAPEVVPMRDGSLHVRARLATGTTDPSQRLGMRETV